MSWPEPDPEQIAEAVNVLKEGGVIAFPTETSYGLGASIRHPRALTKIFEIKNRPETKPLLVLIGATEDLDALISRLPPAALPLIQRFWPGPLTLLLPAREDLPHALSADTGKIGVRISSHPWAHRIVEELGHPVTATSANLSGAPPAYSADEVMRQLTSPAPDYIVDAGRIPPGPPSTIVDVCGDQAIIIRRGAISREDIPA